MNSINQTEKEVEEITIRTNNFILSGRPRINSRIQRPPPGKWWWEWAPSDSERKVFIAAGGIIICDSQIVGRTLKEGIWVLIEKSRKGIGIEYTDIGGKYDWNDCDIYATISREFREELYNTTELPYKTIKQLCQKSTNVRHSFFSSEPRDHLTCNQGQILNDVYIMRKGRYMCLIVDRKALPAVHLSPKDVEIAREITIKNNKWCKSEMYRTLSLYFLPFDEISEKIEYLSYRLLTILKEGILRFRIPNIDKLINFRPKNRYIPPLYSNSLSPPQILK